MSAYRTPGSRPVIETTESEFHLFTVQRYQNSPTPDCPYCPKHASKTGAPCFGRKAFFTRRPLCPSTPHFHPECGTCGGRWLMHTKLSTNGGC